MDIDWKKESKNLLKRVLNEKNITHEQLVEYLASIGIEETKASIDSKLSRGTFSASFLFQCLTAIDCKQLKINFKPQAQIINEPMSKYNSNSKEDDFFNLKTGIKYTAISNFSAQEIAKPLKVVSLFSGAGGLDIGLEQAGFETVACVENDPHCRATLKYNRPNWKLFDSVEKFDQGLLESREAGNIRDIEVNELLELSGLQKGEAALVVGGAPCQPFSNIGKRKGKHDEKNGDLFLEFVRMVKGIQPQAFIFENVAGITQSKHNSVIKYMIDNFAGSGYGISYTTLNSADYGVPQRRIRFFLIGIKDALNPAFPLPTHTKNNKAWEVFTKGLNRLPNYKPKQWKTVQDAFNELPPNYKEREDYAVMNCSPKVVHRMTFIEQGKNFKVLPMELRPNCWKNGKHQGQDTFGRLIADLPSVTIRTAAYNPAKGMYIHPFENRGLNTLEMAALQDFPYEWFFKCANRDRITLVSGGRQIGNAVPPGLAKAIGLSIKKQINQITKESLEKQSEPVEENQFQTPHPQQLVAN